jgi:GNAT superfamily N-acetyltransferase
MQGLKIISIRECPNFLTEAIQFLQQAWPNVLPQLYEDCLTHSINAPTALPQWYLLYKNGEPIDCAGLITNDFISRMDLYPWLCALYISKNHRGNNYAQLLVQHAKIAAKKYGYNHLYLCTNHINYYEKMGFQYIGDDYHPWNERSRIYSINL